MKVSGQNEKGIGTKRGYRNQIMRLRETNDDGIILDL